MSADSRDVLARVEQEKERYLEELMDYLRIPSISADPAHQDDVLRCSEFLAEQLDSAGLRTERIETAGNPLIYAEWSGAANRPTILFYGHYDVQPVDPVEEWRSPPFEPTIRGDQLVARGATDDKGQSFTHVKAISAFLRQRGELPVNVKMILEGEEEIGGESLESFVRQDAGKRLRCDAVVISDTSMFAPGQPSLLYGLKGLAYMQMEVAGPNRDLHSGTFGGAVANPGNALCQLLAQLQDRESGRILIPGFYDDVSELEDWERQEFASLPFDEPAYKAELGVQELFGEEGYSTLERMWTRPTLDVNGLTGGYQGKGAKTVLPSRASAKVSMRLVPDQKPEKIGRLFQEFVDTISPPGVVVKVDSVHGAQPVLIDIEGQIADAAMAAQEEIFGARPVRVREGGSIPIVATFSQVLQVPILLVGFGLPDDRLHAPNEKFNISQFYKGIRTIVRLMDRAGEDSER